MNAKEIQLEFIKLHLKPLLKHWGYIINGQTWFKDKGEFYTLINLQNFSWNSKHIVDFCFNIGVSVKRQSLPDKPTGFNLDIYLREGFYLPNNRKEHLYRNKTGYTITDCINHGSFILEIKTDFEKYVLPYLDNLQTLDDCVDKFGDITFWGDNLKKVIANRNFQ